MLSNNVRDLFTQLYTESPPNLFLSQIDGGDVWEGKTPLPDPKVERGFIWAFSFLLFLFFDGGREKKMESIS